MASGSWCRVPRPLKAACTQRGGGDTRPRMVRLRPDECLAAVTALPWPCAKPNQSRPLEPRHAPTLIWTTYLRPVSHFSVREPAVDLSTRPFGDDRASLSHRVFSKDLGQDPVCTNASATTHAHALTHSSRCALFFFCDETGRPEFLRMCRRCSSHSKASANRSDSQWRET